MFLGDSIFSIRRIQFSDSDGAASSASTDQSAPFNISEYEANSYFYGLSHRGPRLIYRTSGDKFEYPTGRFAFSRRMSLVPVPNNNELGQNGLWDVVRDQVRFILGKTLVSLITDVYLQVVKILDERKVQVSSVDLVRFTWVNGHVEQRQQNKMKHKDASSSDRESFKYEDTLKEDEDEDKGAYGTDRYL